MVIQRISLSEHSVYNDECVYEIHKIKIKGWISMFHERRFYFVHFLRSCSFTFCAFLHIPPPPAFDRKVAPSQLYAARDFLASSLFIRVYLHAALFPASRNLCISAQSNNPHEFYYYFYILFTRILCTTK